MTDFGFDFDFAFIVFSVNFSEKENHNFNGSFFFNSLFLWKKKMVPLNSNIGIQLNYFTEF